MNNIFLPEGGLLDTQKNRECISSLEGLEKAYIEGKILEAPVLLCDSSLRLHVDLGEVCGIIEREECVYCRSGETLKDIAVITRVGKSVAFKITGFKKENGRYIALLSRRLAQEECQKVFLQSLHAGDIIPAKVTHLESFGAFVDIGCGLSSLLTVDNISVSRISHPRDRLNVGDMLNVVVKSKDLSGERLYVSLKELLGTWEENACMFEVGQTVFGIIRSIEEYGVFVELAPNLAGLAEIREDTRDAEIARVGSVGTVYIKSILPDRMKIKLILIDTYNGAPPEKRFKYFVDCENTRHIDSWIYSPKSANKTIETIF